MRRILPVILMALCAAMPMLAQRGGGMRGGGSGGMRGGGSGGMRGGGSSGMRGGGFARGGASPGARVSGGFNTFRGGFAQRPFLRSNFAFRRFPRSAFFPAFYGGFGFYDSYPYASYPYAGYAYSAPPVTIYPDNYYGYPAAQPPQAVVNQGYRPESAPPVVREYVRPEEGKYEQPLYLLAFKDGSIRAVLAYWVQGTALYYVTMDHEQKQSPLASIDRELSDRLNRERNVDFRLPR